MSKAIYSKSVSITLAKIIGDAILPHSNGTVSQRHLDAQAFNPVAYNKIIENSREVLSMGDFGEATNFAVDLIQ